MVEDLRMSVVALTGAILFALVRVEWISLGLSLVALVASILALRGQRDLERRQDQLLNQQVTEAKDVKSEAETVQRSLKSASEED